MIQYGLRYRNNKDGSEGWSEYLSQHMVFTARLDADNTAAFMNKNYPDWTFAVRLYPSGLPPDAWNTVTPVTVPKKRDEKPCPLKGCGAKNDKGAKVCWRCGHPDPYPGKSDDQALAEALKELSTLFP